MTRIWSSSLWSHIGRRRQRRERRVAARIEDAHIVCELSERRAPLPARVDCLGLSRRERRLRNEQVDNRTHAFAIAFPRDGFRLRRARQKITRGANTIGGRAQQI